MPFSLNHTMADKTLEQFKTELEAANAFATQTQAAIDDTIEAVKKLGYNVLVIGDVVAVITSQKFLIDQQQATATGNEVLIKDLTEKQMAFQQVVDEQAALIKDLETQIATLRANPAKAPTITVGKVVYEIHGQKFRFGGKVYTVQDLLADKKLQAELVKKGVGFLVKQEAETEVKNG